MSRFLSLANRMCAHHFPSPQLPPHSRSFRGFSGKASLFTETYVPSCSVRFSTKFNTLLRYNVKVGKPSVQLMTTGAHTLSEIQCGSCFTYVGWKIVRAHEETERWKEGKFLLELEHLDAQPDPVAPLNFRLQKRSSTDTDSGSDY
jgi:hypothetical protein